MQLALRARILYSIMDFQYVQWNILTSLFHTCLAFSLNIGELVHTTSKDKPVFSYVLPIGAAEKALLQSILLILKY